MTIKVNIHEAKTHLSRLLQRVAAGEEFIIAKAGEPIARLSPYTILPKKRQPGNDAGQVFIEANFDDPLPEFDEL